MSNIGAAVGLCGSCLHWQDESDYHESPVKVRRCGRVRMWWDATKWDDEGDSRILAPGYENDLAFAQDASDYRADLITRAEFGCVQWEKATP